MTGGNKSPRTSRRRTPVPRGVFSTSGSIPSPTDRATGAKGGSFVIGLGLAGISPSRANHMAWEASGAFYGNPERGPGALRQQQGQLKNALRDAFAKIGVPSSTVTLGAPTVGTVQEVVPQYTNSSVAPGRARRRRRATPDPDDIREARTNRANHQDNVLFGSSVEIPNFLGHFTAHNVYRVTDPNNASDGASGGLHEDLGRGGACSSRGRPTAATSSSTSGVRRTSCLSRRRT